MKSGQMNHERDLHSKQLMDYISLIYIQCADYQQINHLNLIKHLYIKYACQRQPLPVRSASK